MSTKNMTPEEEYEFYADPDNQTRQGQPRRRKRPPLTEIVPVRLAPETLELVRNRATDNDRSVSSWNPEGAASRIRWARPLLGWSYGYAAG